MSEPDTLSVFAPAKLNLYLHIIGRREDGYHLLDSLFVFADIGDTIDIAPAKQFSFSISGPFSGAFSQAGKDSSPKSGNLVVRAAYRLAETMNKTLDFHIGLTKNLPLSSGIGGGSTDAAATIWGLLQIWQTAPAAVAGLDDLLVSLGADVPACFSCQSAHIRGIGEQITPVSGFPEIPVVLVNCGAACPTGALFEALSGKFTAPAPPHPDNADPGTLIEYLREQRNDFTQAAIARAPEIGDVIQSLEKQNGCRLARVSGSGATCFGLFDTPAAAKNAAANISQAYPAWWVRHGMVGNAGRY